VTGYIVRRLLAFVPTLLLLVLAVVVFGRVTPTSAVDIILGQDKASQVNRARLEARLGLDKPLPVTYAEYVGGMFKGDLGKSLYNARPVTALIEERIEVTLVLTAGGLLIGWSLGTLLGILAAINQNGVLDWGLRGFAIVGLTVPNFALGTAVVLLPAIYFHRPPPVTFVSFSKDPAGHLSQFILPCIVLGVGVTGAVTRIVRTQMLEVLRQDYIRTARAKGLSAPRVVMRHAVRNGMIPVVVILGLQIATVISGSVLIESIFGLPGMGTLAVSAINTKDWPIVQGITVVVGLWTMLVNLAVDLSYGLIDPRIKLTQSAAMGPG
jgi:peptide/nickel transport system permease protein